MSLVLHIYVVIEAAIMSNVVGVIRHAYEWSKTFFVANVPSRQPCRDCCEEQFVQELPDVQKALEGMRLHRQVGHRTTLCLGSAFIALRIDRDCGMNFSVNERLRKRFGA